MLLATGSEYQLLEPVLIKGPIWTPHLPHIANSSLQGQPKYLHFTAILSQVCFYFFVAISGLKSISVWIEFDPSLMR